MKARSSDQKGMSEQQLAVIAPRFPAINQPWIDTYLEQLLKHGYEPVIFTVNHSPQKYGEKVDQLSLREKAVLFPSEGKDIVRGLLKSPGALRFLPTALYISFSQLNPSGKAVKDALFLAWLLGSGWNRGIKAIHSHSEIYAGYFLTASKMLGIPLVLTFHGLPPSGVAQLDPASRIRLYNYASVVLVNTEFAKKQVSGLGCPEAKVRILPQGLPIEDFPFQPSPPPLEGERLRLLSVGRFHRDKGQHYALLALRRLVDRGIDAVHTFVGVGERLEALKALTEQLGLGDRVRFLSGISSPELRALYRESHLFIFPSIDTPGGHVETQGVVLQEAQASGCIPVAMRTGGIPGCLNDGVDALLVDQQSSRQLCEAVMRLLGSPEKWSEMQQKGRKNVEHHYSADVIGEKMADVIASAIDNQPEVAI